MYRQPSKRRLSLMTAALSAFLLPATVISTSSAANAATPSYDLFGDATVNIAGGNPGNAAQFGNDDGTGYGGVDFTGTGVSTLADLDNLSTDYEFTQGSCGVGTPRFGATVTSPDGANTGTIFFYIGPPPGYTDCPADAWVATGNLASADSSVDTSQLDGGRWGDSYAAAQDRYGDYSVSDLFIVSDSGNGAAQTVLIDNTMVGDATYDFGTGTTADECKDGGYASFTDPAFENQGQCVAYANHNDDNGQDGAHAHSKVLSTR